MELEKKAIWKNGELLIIKALLMAGTEPSTKITFSTPIELVLVRFVVLARVAVRLVLFSPRLRIPSQVSV